MIFYVILFITAVALIGLSCHLVEQRIKQLQQNAEHWFNAYQQVSQQVDLLWRAGDGFVEVPLVLHRKQEKAYRKQLKQDYLRGYQYFRLNRRRRVADQFQQRFDSRSLSKGARLPTVTWRWRLEEARAYNKGLQVANYTTHDGPFPNVLPGLSLLPQKH